MSSIKYITNRFNKQENKLTNLFITIHGYRSNEYNLFHNFTNLPDNFFVISLRGIYSVIDNQYSWYDIHFLEKKKFINIKQAKKTTKKIIKFIDEIIIKYKLYNVKVWICGFSQGAMISYSLALEYPQKIDKIIILSGYLENKVISQEQIKRNYKYLNKLDFFISHGKNDCIIPITWAKQSIEKLKEKKIYSISYHEYESGHILCEKNNCDMINWIMERYQK